MEILDGKTFSQKIKAKLSDDIKSSVDLGYRPPRLDMILVGDNYGSQKYVGMKEKAVQSIGMDGVVHRLHAQSNTEDVLEMVAELNQHPGVDGFMVQLPMPDHIDEKAVLEAIDPLKDVDGLTVLSLGRIFHNRDDGFVSATPQGIMLLLDEYGIDLEGKEVVIVGRSKIVGLPLLATMINANATVTVAHSRTRDLENVTKRADVLVSSVGKAHFINNSHVKEGAVVIDVGINPDPNSGKLVGDVDYESVKDKCSYISPVPGGVGPMTIAALLWNCVEAWKRSVVTGVRRS